MPNIKSVITTVLFSILLAGHVFAQNSQPRETSASSPKKSYRDSDLDELKKRAEEQFEGRVFRITTISETFKKGGKMLTYYEKSINENLPPERSRFRVEKKTASGTKSIEYIDIGSDRYVRENDGEWKIFEPTGSGQGSGNGSGSGSGPKIEYTEEKNLVSGEMINGQLTDRYEEILRYTFTYPDRVEKRTMIESYWFNKAGLFVKKLLETRDETDNTADRTTTNYEYDFNLTIERPVVRAEKKTN
jgi:hypothetical protein